MNDIIITSNIVCCVIYSHGLVLVDALILENHGEPIIGGGGRKRGRCGGIRLNIDVFVLQYRFYAGQ